MEKIQSKQSIHRKWKEEENLNVGSLDELFSDESLKSTENAFNSVDSKPNTSGASDIKFDFGGLNNDSFTNNDIRSNPVSKVEPVQLGASTPPLNAPTIPLANDIGITNTNNVSVPPVNEETDELDIQKELEAKFDELFGPIDDSNS